MSEVVLSVSGLQKSIGGKQLIHDISFEVMAGEVYGFLGPNGAGKTTTIRMLVGLTRPNSGEITIGGHSLQKQFIEAIRHVGSIVENPELYSFLTGRENLEMFARMSGTVTKERIEEVIKQVELTEAIDQKVKTYSLGMRQRLGIGQALLHSPKLLILDEPTNGLDPAGIRELREFIQYLAHEQKIGVFISSHLLSEIELMCDRVAIINKGRVISVGAVHDMMEQFADHAHWFFTEQSIGKAVEVMNNCEYVYELQALSDGRVKCRMDTERIGELNRLLVHADVDVLRIESKTVTLEDLFLSLTAGTPGEEGENHV
ncbi:ABC transporter ATP-binding protein [Brevibacillus daliensis]|uniref:ABC transporter ATP-binding protein n=1 Tax=Brevibacillus daliensis TaxID=2892995 RepID=UPI001E4ED5F1|nr:ABC transporter ATP-binding protein [Brevibacillus daliensis]